MEQGLIDIRNQARKKAKEEGSHSAYLISCSTLIAILDELEAAQPDTEALIEEITQRAIDLSQYSTVDQDNFRRFLRERLRH